ncbi:putative lanthionine synthetase C family protein [Aspergillus taichungensis]|uniref:Putative lanthionine synthetase C family protein n=1 Tax=Aspergillus taichungensis TaxID=482145 RepID=A0A2J5I367_9EURO|nr:putative lanthionine synthetase C family protein [Aspergillus taichungensis]
MHPQYYENTLNPIAINEDGLQTTLRELQVAVQRGTLLVHEGSPPPSEWGSGGLYVGHSGIAIAFLRLARQASSLSDGKDQPPDFRNLVNEYILPDGPDAPILPARLSPVGSAPVAAVVTRILAAGTFGGAVSDSDISCLRKTVDIALANPPLLAHSGRRMGGDELLYGRGGLLWAVLNIRVLRFDHQTTKALQPVFDAIPRFVDVVVQAGREGHKDYVQRHGEKDALPLMWAWMEDYYGLGSVHGMAGILAVLLACNPEELDHGSSRNHLPLIAGTISGLCKLCIANNGHLPTSIPLFSSSSHRKSPLVQICHGSPGLVHLMACARRNAPLVSRYWDPSWDEAIYLASERIWEEGLLYKGGGLCHGFVGNALTLLYMYESFEYDQDLMQTARQNYVDRTKTAIGNDQHVHLTSDYFLSRALAFLLHGRQSPPYDAASHVYRVPDRPFSLAEGLSGTVCAWAEACVAVQAKLRKMELEKDGRSVAFQDDSVFRSLTARMLGFPTLAYYRPTGAA